MPEVLDNEKLQRTEFGYTPKNHGQNEHLNEIYSIYMLLSKLVLWMDCNC
jgi:hypothetical protein